MPERETLLLIGVIGGLLGFIAGEVRFRVTVKKLTKRHAIAMRIWEREHFTTCPLTDLGLCPMQFDGKSSLLGPRNPNRGLKA